MSKPESPAYLVRNWRGTLMATLVGLLIALAMAMKWLVEFQVESAEERRSIEAIARAAQMRCFELASHRATAACRAAVEAKRGTAP